MPRVLIFANPIAGRGKGKSIAQRLDQRLARAGYAVSLFLNRADSLAAGPLPPDVAAAIVIGGDGTLRGVAQWAIDRALQNIGAASAPAGQPPGDCIPYPLLIVPMGTANLMGKHLGIAWDDRRLPDQVLQSIQRRQLAHLDVARTPGGVFLLMASVGFDASVVHELGRIRSGPIDMTDYVLPALKAFADYHFPRLTVTVDGRQVFADEPGFAIVGNVPEYGTGFSLLPEARPDDQLLDICVMPCSSRGQLIHLALAAAAGEHVREEGVVYLKGKRVRIDSPLPTPAQADGEPAGNTPVEIDLLPGKIPFIVP